jgi:hypothetical protein
MRSFLLLALGALATAKTDLTGCTSSDVIAYGGASVLYYVPGTGEICSFLDCGGGRAPPKTTVPGCPLYSGTATYSPSFLPGFKDGSAATVSSTAYAAATTPSPSTAMITGSSTADVVASQATLSGLASSSSDVSSDSVSTKSVTSTTGTATNSQSTSSSGTKSSGSTSASGSGSSTSSAASSSNTTNAGASISVDLLAHGIIGAAAAGFAFIL